MPGRVLVGEYLLRRLREAGVRHVFRPCGLFERQHGRPSPRHHAAADPDAPLPRLAVARALAAAAIALALGQVIGFVDFRPRPYLTHPVHLLIAPNTDPSFPSDHALAAFAIASALAWTHRRLGICLGVAGALISLARGVRRHALSMGCDRGGGVGADRWSEHPLSGSMAHAAVTALCPGYRSCYELGEKPCMA